MYDNPRDDYLLTILLNDGRKLVERCNDPIAALALLTHMTQADQMFNYIEARCILESNDAQPEQWKLEIR